MNCGPPQVLIGLHPVRRALRAVGFRYMVPLWALVLLCVSGPSPAQELDTDRDLQAAVERLSREMDLLRQALSETSDRIERISRLTSLDRYRFPPEISLFGEPLPLQRRDVWERMDREFLLCVDDVPQVLLWIKRAHRYFPMIEARIRQEGLPEDLKYVAIVESALRPMARSRAGAVGLWQFIPSTGRKYRLRKDGWVDERRDPLKATEAALAYLKDLKEMFGDWFLAVAAYNAGEKRIQKELERQRVESYFDLVLPLETERYVFRIASAKVILSDPKQYGFELAAQELYPPLPMEPVNVEIQSGTLDLVDLAQSCGMTFRQLRERNPHLRMTLLPQGRYTLYFPPGKAAAASAFLEDWRKRRGRHVKRADFRVLVHRVRPGETLSGIAQKYKVSLRQLKRWNGLQDVDVIYAGQRLKILR